MKDKIKFKRSQSGITLIALVVTIIVLLILAGISINMLTGQNGILNRAAEAKEKTGTTQTEETVKLSVTDALTRGTGSLTDENLKAALNSNIGAGKYEISGDATSGWTVTVNGKEYKIDSTGKISGTTSGGSNGENSGNTGSLPTGTGTTPYLPDETKFEKVEGTDLDSGLVIKEKATGSEYVWVEVPRTTAVYPEEKLNITEFTDEEYTNIETYLHTYTNYYRNGTSCSDTWYDATNDRNEKNKSDWYQSESDYNTAKKKMLKSVYQNGGFWVGRYEAGIEVNRTRDGDATTIPLSKENLYPYTYVTRTQAKKLAEQVESGSYTSSLMFGVQWDLVLKYIETKNATTQYSLKTNSTTIGNYYNSTFTLNRGKFAKYGALSDWKDYNSEEKPTLVTGSQKKSQRSYENGILLTTGATEATNLQNIYDIAGNVCEWTLEFRSTSSPCTSRGGSYSYNDGSNNPVYHRDPYDTYRSFHDLGFRLSLY
mgnify:CR=1 FL=1